MKIADYMKTRQEQKRRKRLHAPATETSVVVRTVGETLVVTLPRCLALDWKPGQRVKIRVDGPSQVTLLREWREQVTPRLGKR